MRRWRRRTRVRTKREEAGRGSEDEEGRKEEKNKK